MGLPNGPALFYVKSFTEEFHTRPYMVTKRRCVWNKTLLLGPTVWNKAISFFISPFIHNVSLYEMPTKASNKRNQKDKVLKWLHVAMCPDYSFFQTHAQPCTVQPTKGQQKMKSFISNWWLSAEANSPDVSGHGREVLTRLVQTLNSSSTKPLTVPVA